MGRYHESKRRENQSPNHSTVGSIISSVGLLVFGLGLLTGSREHPNMSLLLLGVALMGGGALWLLVNLLRDRKN
jgi:hypothetical protein